MGERVAPRTQDTSGQNASEEGTLGEGRCQRRGPSEGDTPQRLCFPDGVGIGAQAEVNSFQLSFCLSDHTLPPEKGASQGPVVLSRERDLTGPLSE